MAKILSHKEHLERARRDYEETKNPLFVFEAFASWYRLQRKYPLPEWIGDYLRDSTDRLLGWDPEKSERSGTAGTRKFVPWDEQNQTVARAMGFRGEIEPARKEWGGQHAETERLALLLVEYMWAMGVSLENAANKPPDGSGASRSKARRAVENASSFALARMRSRLEEAGWEEADGPVWKQFSRLCSDGTKRPGLFLDRKAQARLDKIIADDEARADREKRPR